MGCALSDRSPLSRPSPPSRLSFWHETAGTDWTPRPALPGPTTADVAVVGAGYTGLWTAHYLAEADPSLRVVVLEEHLPADREWAEVMGIRADVEFVRLSDAASRIWSGDNSFRMVTLVRRNSSHSSTLRWPGRAANFASRIGSSAGLRLVLPLMNSTTSWPR